MGLNAHWYMLRTWLKHRLEMAVEENPTLICDFWKRKQSGCWFFFLNNIILGDGGVVGGIAKTNNKKIVFSFHPYFSLKRHKKISYQLHQIHLYFSAQKYTKKKFLPEFGKYQIY